METTTENPTLKGKILDRLVVDEEEVEVEEGASPLRDDVIDAKEFVDILEGIEHTLDQISILTETVEELRSTGLKKRDLVALLYGKSNDLNKGTITSVLGAIADLEQELENEARHIRIIRRVLADMSGEGKRKTNAVLVGLQKIADRYGDDR